jgi:hypothetical protein
MAEANDEASAEQSSESTNTSIAKLQEIRILHHRLMAIYVYAIAAVSLKEPLPGTSEETSLPAQSADSPPSVTAPVHKVDGERKNNAQRSLRSKRRPVTKILVGSHIKRKLDELKTAYAQIEQAVPDDDTMSDFRIWLKDAQDSLSRFSGTLPHLASVRAVATTLWPAIASLVGISALWNVIFTIFGKEILKPDSLVAWGFAVLATLVYTLIAVMLAESKKRDFFLSSISISSMWYGTPPNELDERLTANNVYEAEDELFKCIGRSKRVEVPLDMYAEGVAALGLAILISGGSIFFTKYRILPHTQPVLDLKDKIGIVLVDTIFLPLGLIVIIQGRRRKPR